MAVRYLAIESPRSRIVLRGTFSGGPERCSLAQSRVLLLADTADNMREIVNGLTDIADDEGMVLETGDTGGDQLAFYLWERTALP